MLEAQRDKHKVHFATLMDKCHLKKMRSWNQNCRKTKAESCSGWDIAKDDSVAYAVFTEQGSSASQMTAAKVVDVIANLPDCSGQTADAVFAQIQVNIGGCSNFKSQNTQIYDIRLPRHEWPKSWANIEDPVVPLERNF